MAGKYLSAMLFKIKPLNFESCYLKASPMV
jgi:hypothetical protein